MREGGDGQGWQHVEACHPYVVGRTARVATTTMGPYRGAYNGADWLHILVNSSIQLLMERYETCNIVDD